MNYQGAFLHAILDHPEDDAPRLVFADWLDEQGQSARAAFIRAQCRLAQLSPEAPAYAELELTVQDLLREHARDLAAPLDLSPSACGFERGFLTSVRLSAHSFLRSAKELFRHAPIQAAHILVNYQMPPLPDFLACPYLHRVRQLTITGRAAENEIRGISFAPFASGLTTLSFIENDALTPSAIEGIASSPHLANLRTLELSTQSSTRFWPNEADVIAAHLASSAPLGRLESLALQKLGLGANGLQALAASSHLAQLKSLVLADNDFVGDAAIQALAQSAILDSVTRLALRRNLIEDAGAAALALSRHVSALQYLDLSGNRLGGGVQALAESRCLTGLIEISLGEGVTDAALQILAQSQHFPHLQRLRLERGKLTATGLRALAFSPLMEQLTELDMTIDGRPGDLLPLTASPHVSRLHTLRLSLVYMVGDAEPFIAALSASPHFSALRSLELSYFAISSREARLLAASPLLAQLRMLSLRHCPIGDMGVKVLARSPQLAGLIALDLRGTRMSAEGARALAASRFLRLLRTLWLSEQEVRDRVRDEVTARWGPRFRLLGDG